MLWSLRCRAVKRREDAIFKADPSLHSSSRRGCDAEKHKNKWGRGGGCAATQAAQIKTWRLMLFFCYFLCKKKKKTAQKWHTATGDCSDALCTGIFYQKGPSHLWGWFIKPSTLTTESFPLQDSGEKSTIKKCILISISTWKDFILHSSATSFVWNIVKSNSGSHISCMLPNIISVTISNKMPRQQSFFLKICAALPPGGRSLS